MTLPLALAAPGITLIGCRCSVRSGDRPSAAPARRGPMLPPATDEALFDQVLDACEAVAGTERAFRHAIDAQLAPGRL